MEELLKKRVYTYSSLQTQEQVVHIISFRQLRKLRSLPLIQGTNSKYQ